MTDIGTMDDFLEILSHAVSSDPHRLTDIESWHQHIPFAKALMRTMRPTYFVELGTHRGDSYCAFCQAIQEGKLPTKAWAVDTWEGDPQAGLYDSEVFEELSAYLQPRYGHFSTLLRMRFEHALNQFADHSIQLLHIDGLHTYEAVLHDFETWLPKVAEDGVILFHDTSAKGEGYEVDRLWAELSAIYPGFEFKHGNGLGVLLPGKSPPNWLLAWCNAAEETQNLVRQIFDRLGERLQLKRHIGLYREQNDALWKRVAIAERNVDDLLQDNILKLRYVEENAKLWERVHQAEANFDQSNLALDQLRAASIYLAESLAQAQREQQKISAQNAEVEARNAQLDTQIKQILKSKSWQITAPLRVLARYFTPGNT